MLRLKGFLFGRRGVAAVEFALIAPVLAMLWVGIIEASNLHLVGRAIRGGSGCPAPDR
jgi:Flp pilus assembly protein TadG